MNHHFILCINSRKLPVLFRKNHIYLGMAEFRPKYSGFSVINKPSQHALISLYVMKSRDVTPLFIKITILFLLFNLSFSLQSQDPTPCWTSFRGPDLNGIAEGAGYAVSWDDSTQVEWKASVPGRGWSSPLVLGSQIWLTTEENREMRALCYNWDDGALVHDIPVFHPDTLYRKHSVNTYATPTGTLEDGFLYVHFGRYGTACLERETGEILWKRTDLQCEHIQGSGSSLFIYLDKLIVHMEGADVQYIVALDKKTGETIWRTERPKEVYDELEPIGKKAYITPIIIRVNGQDLLISNGSAACIAYDPQTGIEVWRIVQGEDSTISMPVSGDGILYFYTSFIVKDGDKYCELLAVDPDGKGDIGDTNVLWRLKSPILQLSTPVVVDGLLYTVDSRSQLSCLDGLTGKTIWTEKLTGKYNTSPVFADGLIYISSTQGKTHVFKAGRRWEPVAENSLEGEIWATPAFTQGAIVMRTSEFLYKIGEH
jgi:outer membrane protein assembly factor BamB